MYPIARSDPIISRGLEDLKRFISKNGGVFIGNQVNRVDYSHQKGVSVTRT